MIGQLISHYRILEKLGAGGMGEVFLAEDTKLERKVALKFLPAQFSADVEERKRFIHEAKAAAALNHPNIVTVHEIGEHEGQIFIAMEYVEGRTLKEIIDVGARRAVPLPITPHPLPITQVIDIAVQIASGLSAAHAKGIVHRDLKPANIMLSEQGQAKIVDFGLAKLKGMSRLTRSGTTLGTVAYMSPEQALGKKVDQRTDIWSLGVILYEILAGQLPFRGEYDQAVLYAVINEEPESISKIRSDIPDELQRIVRRALAKRPENRYQSANELLKELKQFHQSVVAPETVAFNFRHSLLRPKIIIPALLIVFPIATASFFYLKHQAKVKWAREDALPQVERLIAETDPWRNLVPAFKLAEKAEAYIPHDPKLAALLSKCSLKIDIITEPPGARVYFKEYAHPGREWEYLGISPLKKTRVPIGVFRWKFEKEGCETVMAADSTWIIDFESREPLFPHPISRSLDRTGGIPRGMVRVKGAEIASGIFDDFFIDTCEVTNKIFKEFIIAGGYRNKIFWKERFVQNRKELAWEEAIGEFVDQTGQPGPAGWQAGDYPEGQSEFPVSGVSWYEAAAFAEFTGKRLPTVFHWNIARGRHTPLLESPQVGGLAIFAPFSNFMERGPVAVGRLQGMTAYGALDMAGNVREWCWNETPEGRAIRGGAWGDYAYMFNNVSQAPAMDRSAKNGIRCALYPESSRIPKSAFKELTVENLSVFFKQTPVAESIFRVYRDQFSYDRTNLHPRVETPRKSSGDWIQEKVSFDAAYGGERITAYLFLPTHALPPYQTVIFVGGGFEFERSSWNIENHYIFSMFLSFILKNGRAVLFPVYKGTFERGNDELAKKLIQWDSHQSSEIFVQQFKDYKRCIDYLQTRRDIDSRKLAYYGASWGGIIGPIILAIEDRLKAGVLVAGGLVSEFRPETNPINYLTRVKQPTLMLNGRYDTGLPPETSSKPMFDQLGTRAKDKRQVFYDTDHVPPLNEIIKETLAWLDKYLGPVKR